MNLLEVLVVDQREVVFHVVAYLYGELAQEGGGLVQAIFVLSAVESRCDKRLGAVGVARHELLVGLVYLNC